MTRFTRFAAIGIVAALFGQAMPAVAAPINNVGGLSGTQTLVDFSQFTGAGQITSANGPIQLGGLVAENLVLTDVSGGNNIWLYNSGWNLLNNGSWGAGRNGFLGIFDDNGPLRINFNSGSVAGFGFFMNVVVPGAEFVPVILRAYNSGGGLIEAYDVSGSISTPGGVDAGAFRGIQLGGNDIAYIELLGDTAVFDDFRFTRKDVVPEPSVLALLALGVGGVLRSQRRKKLN